MYMCFIYDAFLKMIVQFSEYWKMNLNSEKNTVENIVHFYITCLKSMQPCKFLMRPHTMNEAPSRLSDNVFVNVNL